MFDANNVQRNLFDGDKSRCIFYPNMRKNLDTKNNETANEASSNEKQQSELRTDASSTLHQACLEYKREDLEQTLARIIYLEARGRDPPSLLGANTRAGFSIAANVYDVRRQSRRCARLL